MGFVHPERPRFRGRIKEANPGADSFLQLPLFWG